MLLSFTFENWKSYRDSSTINFVAGRRQSHKETLTRIPGYKGMKILPISGIWGGNAGGKTNLLEALKFVKNFVTLGCNSLGRIPVEGFRPASDVAPSHFSVTFLVGGRIYQLEFTLTMESVIEENLFWLTHQREWRGIYARTTDHQGNAQVEFADEASPELADFTSSLDQLKMCVRGCGPYRLFLTNTVDQRIDVFSPLYEWFNSTLRYAGASTQFTRFPAMMSDERYCALFGSILKALDTGIERVGLEDVPEDGIISGLPEPIRRDLQERDNFSMQFEMGWNADAPSDVYLISKKDGIVKTQRVQTYRRGRDGELKPFGFRNESSGTRRLLEILPIFTDLWIGDTECVWVLDEIDKDFHTDLTRALVEQFLLHVKRSNTGGAYGDKEKQRECRDRDQPHQQMLFATHDLMLMEQDLLRIDEINVAERKRDGSSVLIPLHEYNGLRNDLDLRKSYLEGRFGGVPRLEPILVDFGEESEREVASERDDDHE